MNNFRRNQAWLKRNEANQLASQRPHPRHESNGDEQKFRHQNELDVSECHKQEHLEMKESKQEQHVPYKEKLDLNGKPSYLMSFTKGMPHSYETGLLRDPQHFQYFVRAIDSGDPRDFRDTPLGPDEVMGHPHYRNAPKEGWKSEKAKKGKCGEAVGLRAWESQSAGLSYELEGPDAQSVTMPPAPRLGSAELTGEMAEVYIQALLRDIPFNNYSAGITNQGYLSCTDGNEDFTVDQIVNDARMAQLKGNLGDLEIIIEKIRKLRALEWFSLEPIKLNPQEEARRCNRQCPHPGNAFRGITLGDDIGPYISQFLLIGNSGINSNDAERTPADGLISYGSISIEQKVRTACPGVDYMQTWDEWFDVQNAANVSKLETYVDMLNTATDEQKVCFEKMGITTCSKSDELEPRRFIYTPRDLATYVHYDALYEAYLNACLILLGNGMPFDPGIPFQEDDNRDHQQGFAHFGGPHILSLVTEVATRALKAVRYQKYNVHRRCRPEVLAARIHKHDLLKEMAPEIEGTFENLKTAGILDHVSEHNNGADNYLLPMAFCEGSPMHPAYGAGHATVAGACITILKAFFDCKSHFKPNGRASDQAYVSINDGKELCLVPVFNQKGQAAHLTVEGELNKLASNISIGRDWAGVHYFSDYYESLLMGEQIALGILEEQKLMFTENFSMTVPLFGGDTVRI